MSHESCFYNKAFFFTPKEQSVRHMIQNGLEELRTRCAFHAFRIQVTSEMPCWHGNQEAWGTQFSKFILQLYLHLVWVWMLIVILRPIQGQKHTVLPNEFPNTFFTGWQHLCFWTLSVFTLIIFPTQCNLKPLLSDSFAFRGHLVCAGASPELRSPWSCCMPLTPPRPVAPAKGSDFNFWGKQHIA
jgi:hypothetical protein